MSAVVSDADLESAHRLMRSGNHGDEDCGGCLDHNGTKPGHFPCVHCNMLAQAIADAREAENRACEAAVTGVQVRLLTWVESPGLAVSETKRQVRDAIAARRGSAT